MRRWLQSSRRAGQDRGRLAIGDPLLYAQAYGLLLYLRADRGVTLGTTLRPGGTSPPAVTISGNLTDNGLGLHLAIDSVAGGVDLGQATYKWSIDDGVTFVATGVPTAAGPTALGTTGVSVSFAAGPYNINNFWDGVIAEWADQSGQGNTVTQATLASQPVYQVNQTVGTFSPRREVLFAVDFMTRPACDLFGAGTYTIIAANRAGSLTTGRVDFGNGDGATGAYIGSGAGPTRALTHVGAFTATDGALQTSTYEVVTARRSAGAAPTMRINGVDSPLTGATATFTPTTGASVLFVGAFHDGTLPHSSRFSRIMVYRDAVPDSVAAALEAGMFS